MAIKNILLSTIFIVLLISLTSAFGVSSPYWEENPLVVERGGTETVNINIQNMVGDKDIKVKAELLSGSEITSLEEDTFLVQAGTSDTLVPLIVKMPKDAVPGENNSIKVEFKTIQEDAKGISMGTGMTVAFNVIAGEAVAETSSKTITVVIIAAIVLIIIIWVILKNRKKR